jgi:peptide chain release factor 1
MNESIRDKLEHLAGRLDELDRMLAHGDATRDIDEYRRLSREHAELGPLVKLYHEWRRAQADLVCRSRDAD